MSSGLPGEAPSCSSEHPEASPPAPNFSIIDWGPEHVAAWLRTEPWDDDDLKQLESVTLKKQLTENQLLAHSIEQLEELFQGAPGPYVTLERLMNLRFHLTRIARLRKKASPPSSTPASERAQPSRIKRRYSTAASDAASKLIESIPTFSFPEIKSFLSRHHLDHNIQDRNGWSLLHAAAHAGRLEIFLDLLKLGVRGNLVTVDGALPLHYLVRLPASNLLDRCIRKVLRKTATINQPNNRGETALHNAILKQNARTVVMLLEMKADPDATTTRGETPLHLAVHVRCAPIIRILLQYKADPTIDSNAKQTPISLARGSGDLALMSLFENPFSSLKTSTTLREEDPGSNLSKMAPSHQTVRERDDGDASPGLSSSARADDETDDEFPTTPSHHSTTPDSSPSSQSPIRSVDPRQGSRIEHNTPRKGSLIADSTEHLSESASLSAHSSDSSDSLSFDPKPPTSASEETAAKSVRTWDTQETIAWFKTQSWLIPEELSQVCEAIHRHQFCANDIFQMPIPELLKAFGLDSRSPIAQAARLKLQRELKMSKPAVAPQASYEAGSLLKDIRAANPTSDSLRNPGSEHPRNPNPTPSLKKLISPSASSISSSPSMSAVPSILTKSEPTKRISASASTPSSPPPPPPSAGSEFGWDNPKTLDWIRQQTWLGQELQTISQAVATKNLTADSIYALPLAELRSACDLSPDSPSSMPLMQALRQRLLRELKLIQKTPPQPPASIDPSQEPKSPPRSPRSQRSDTFLSQSASFARASSKPDPPANAPQPSSSRRARKSLPSMNHEPGDFARVFASNRLSLSSVSSAPSSLKTPRHRECAYTSASLTFRRIFSLRVPCLGEIHLTGTRLSRDHPLVPELIKISRMGNFDRFYELASLGHIPSIDVGIMDGKTFLHLVIDSGSVSSLRRLECVRSYFQAGGTKNLRDGLLCTPLHAAALGRRFDVFSLLLSQGSDPFGRSLAGDFPLHLLLQDLNTERLADDERAALKAILAHPSTSLLLNKHDLRSLLCSPSALEYIQSLIPKHETTQAHTFLDGCSRGDVEFITVLLGKDPNLIKTRDALGRTGPTLALIHGQLELFRYFGTHCPDAVGLAKLHDGANLMHLAVFHRQTETTDYLLAHFRSLTQEPDSTGFCPLHVAAFIGDQLMFHKLKLKSTIKPKPSVLPPIFLSCFCGSIFLIESELSSGASPQCFQPIGFSPDQFYSYCQGCNFLELKQLINDCTIVDSRLQKVSKRQTHLSLSNMGFNDDFVRILLRRVSSNIERIQHLTSVSLKSNRLTRIPFDLLFLPGLVRVALDDNALELEVERNLMVANFRTTIRTYLKQLSGRHINTVIGSQAARFCSWSVFERQALGNPSAAARYSSPLGETCLHEALLERQVPASARCEFLAQALKHDASPTAFTFPARESPLHLAARLGCLDSIDLLLNHGADPLQVNANGENFLHVLYQTLPPGLDPPVLVQRLPPVLLRQRTRLELMAPGDFRLAEGRRRSVVSEPLNLTFFLPSRRPDLEALAQVLIFAILQGKESLFFKALSSVEPLFILTIRDDDGLSLLDLSVRRGHVNVVAGLLQKLSSDPIKLKDYIHHRSKPPTVDDSVLLPTPPLHVAAELGHHTILELLLAHTKGVNDAVEPLLRTPLIAACSGTHPSSGKIVALLLQNGANPLQRSVSGDTPLHFAISTQCLEAVYTLLKCNLELVIQKNNAGITPLEAIYYLLRRQPNYVTEQIYRICSLARDVVVNYLSQDSAARPVSRISLKEMELVDSEVDILLPSLVRLQGLRTIVLKGNYISRIPVPLLAFPNLKTVDLSKNVFFSVPSEIQLVNSSRDSQKILRYLSDCQKNPHVEQKRAKIIVCGNESTGKSALSLILANNLQPLSQKDRESLQPTDGINIGSFPIADVAVSLWDFSGLSVYETIQELLICNSALYLLFWDLRTPISEAGLERWCRTIRSRVSSCRVMIIGTHIDLIPEIEGVTSVIMEQVRELCGTFPFVRGIQFVSSTTAQGVPELGRWLTDHLQSSHIPASTLAESILSEYLDSSLYQQLLPIFSFDALYQLVSKLTIFALATDPLELFFSSLVRLHEVGRIFLLSGRTTQQQDYSSVFIVLDPKWLVEVMFRLGSSKLPSSDGLVSYSAFIRALEPHFVATTHKSVIEVLTIVGFLIPLASESGLPLTSRSFFIPALLPVKRPRDAKLRTITPLSEPDAFLPDAVSSLPKESAFWSFERWCLFSWRPPLIHHFLAAEAKSTNISAAWKRGAVISNVGASQLENDLLLDEHDFLDEAAGQLVRAVRFSLRVALSSDNFRETLSLAAKCFRRVRSQTEKIVNDLFPNNPILRWVIPCPQCYEIEGPANDRYLFDDTECVSALFGGKSWLRCPKCVLAGSLSDPIRLSDFLSTPVFSPLSPSEPAPISAIAASCSADPSAPSTSVDLSVSSSVSVFLPLSAPYTFSLMFLVPDYTLCDFSQVLVEPDKDFQIEEQIGRGGFGRVYKGTLHRSTPCAVKISENEDSFDEMVRECLSLTTGHHPNIVSFLGYALKPVPSILLEFMAGGDLYRFAHDPWRFLLKLDQLYQAASKALLQRDRLRDQPDFSLEEWSFSNKVEASIAGFRSLNLPASCEASIGIFIREILASMENFWKDPTYANAVARDSLIDRARLLHQCLLQAPEFIVPIKKILQVALELACSLAHLHSLTPPLVHLDVKSLNVLLASADLTTTQGPLVKLTDFGTVTEYTPPMLSNLGSCKHLDINPRWAAPEVHRGAFHPNSDIWSWALILWELFTREMPFSGVAVLAGSLSDSILQGLRPLSSPLIPKPVMELMSSCWELDPDLRPSAENLVQRIGLLMELF